MKDLIKHQISHLSAGGKTITDKTAKVGDILLSDDTWITSAAYAEHKDEIKAKPVGICGIPKGVLPDGKGRLVSVDFMSEITPETGSKTPEYLKLQTNNSNDLNGEQFGVSTKFQGTINGKSFDTIDSKYYGYLASDLYLGTTDDNDNPTSSYLNLNYSEEDTSNFIIPMLKEENILNPDIFKTELVIEGTSSSTSLLDINTTKVPLSDFDGESHCEWIINYNDDSDTLLQEFPAIGACSMYKKGNRKWYLPSCGELLLIFTKGSEFFKSLSVVKDGGLGAFFYATYWTSNIFVCNNISSAFYVYPHVGHVHGIDRNNTHSVLAVSAF